ncbi:MAG: BTAD domain-containing putative transcriptional regulator [Desulfobacteraceae bacterium]
MPLTSFDMIHGSNVKFSIPDTSDAIQRERLFALFNDNRQKRIALVLGQAAQGKSTLVASYLKTVQAPTVWLHLGSENTDHTNLFHLLLSAFDQRQDQNIFHARGYPQVTLGTRQDIVRQQEILFARFDRAGTPMTIVLDDLEALAVNASAFDLIQGIMDEMPSNIRLFLLSRKMPPLSIQRLKIKNKLLIVENRELAFTLDEAKAFFAGRAQPGRIPSDQIKKIHAVTDGWAGGLTLINETLKKNPHFKDLPHQLSWDTIDFFSEEIFSNQQEHIKEFLVTASFFDTIDPEIIRQFSTVSDPLAILAELERRNLFIQRVEQKETGPVFRFNRLFKDFLENLLTAQKSDRELKQLCSRAGEIFYGKEEYEAAIKYFTRGEAFDRAAGLIKKIGTDMVIKGRFSDLYNWIEALPQQITWKDPWLIYYFTMTRRINGGRQNIKDFSTALALFRENCDTRGTMLCLAHLIEAAVFLQRSFREITLWIRQAEELLVSVSKESMFTYARAMLWQHMGFGLIAGTNEAIKGISACKNACILGEKIKNSDLQLNATIVSILGHVFVCDFEQADEALHRIRNLTREGIHPEYRALKNLVNIQLLLKKGELDKTEELLKLSEKDIETFGLVFLYPGFIEAKAMYFVYTKEYPSALQSADHLFDISILAGNSFYSGISRRIRGTVFYHQGDFARARRETEKALAIFKNTPRGEMPRFLAKTLLGLILLNQEELTQAEKELSGAVDYFTRFSSTLSLVETSAALGLVMWHSDRESRAADHITRAMATAETEGYDHFIVMSPGDFTRCLLLKAIFDLNAPSPFTTDLISTKYADHAGREIEVLAALPVIAKKKQQKALLKQLFCCSLPRLRISTFGEFRVYRQEGIAMEINNWQGSMPKRLLKAIIIQGKTDIPKEVLMEALWPESSEDSGEKKFKINLYRLRKSLEPHAKKTLGYAYVTLENGFVSLDPRLVSLDVDDFLGFYAEGEENRKNNFIDRALASYKRAEALYQGDFLAEEPYIDWVANKRYDLKMTFLDMLQTQARLYSQKQEKMKAIACLKKAVQADPLLEPAYQELMILYSELGRYNTAFRVFTRCKETIQREIGTDPDRKTLDIHRKIQQMKK